MRQEITSKDDDRNKRKNKKEFERKQQAYEHKQEKDLQKYLMAKDNGKLHRDHMLYKSLYFPISP